LLRKALREPMPEAMFPAMEEGLLLQFPDLVFEQCGEFLLKLGPSLSTKAQWL
jgi:hypothetical protein